MIRSATPIMAEVPAQSPSTPSIWFARCRLRRPDLLLADYHLGGNGLGFRSPGRGYVLDILSVDGCVGLEVLAHHYLRRQPHRDAYKQAEAHLPYHLILPFQAILVVNTAGKAQVSRGL